MTSPYDPSRDGQQPSPYVVRPGYPPHQPPADYAPVPAARGCASQPYPQQGFPQAGHGYPCAPRPRPTEYGEGRPTEVDLAFWLFIGNVLLMVTGIALQFVYLDRIVAMAGVTGSAGEADAVAVASRAGLTFGAVVSGLAAVLWLVFIFMMRAGRHWARIVLTIFGALSVVFSLVGLSRPQLHAIMVAGGLQVVVLSVGTVLMFRPAANRFFAQGG
ncbi:hypothetical protein GCM10012275_45440 [Longimycelium tulufanense]|uniref:Uncharacterized protein n=1 Tax=Longimycelium tulufanense TaxID=907463 RepID=A0A8J3FVM6_9PSEU|nr:DUF3824 domain-containing protein [Longimycelium tulufanense]GGM69807.1 hypothetical protein GCM10012275_45440 [Longimycelium tulufanense]